MIDLDKLLAGGYDKGDKGRNPEVRALLRNNLMARVGEADRLLNRAANVIEYDRKQNDHGVTEDFQFLLEAVNRMQLSLAAIAIASLPHFKVRVQQGGSKRRD